MWFLNRPSAERIEAFLAEQRRLPVSYPEVGASRTATRGSSPMGYNLDYNRVLLGRGEKVFQSGCAALRQWRMFPAPWTQIVPNTTPLEEGRVVVVLAHACGVWWLNACRIVYTIDESTPVRRYGFAYGTLPGHVECGEERFSVEWLPDDTVWYDLLAFSRPRYWPVRLATPWARQLQAKFAADSKAAMQQAAAIAGER